jgi:hypothetical protein
MYIENNWPAGFGWGASRSPDVEIEAILFLDEVRFWCGIFVLEQHIGVRVDWLWTDRTESSVVARLPRWLAEGK